MVGTAVADIVAPGAGPNGGGPIQASMAAAVATGKVAAFFINARGLIQAASPNATVMFGYGRNELKVCFMSDGDGAGRLAHGGRGLYMPPARGPRFVQS